MTASIDLMLRFFDNDLTDEEVIELDRLIARSPESARLMARLAIEQAHYGPVVGRVAEKRRAEAASPIEGISASKDANFALAHAGERREAEELLQYLLRIEKNTPAIGRDRLGPDLNKEPAQHLADHAATKQSSAHSSRLPLQLALTKVARWSVAAAFILAVTLAIVFIASNNVTHSHDLANNETESINARPVVATLSAQFDAQWEDAGLSVDKELHVGQRLALTAGYAEITTGRGAVVILEAPCTVELIDHDNAIRLHSGKLIGICETPTSKGLLVRTRHMNITDLGTRFGVDATAPEAVQAHVFEGEIEVSAPSADRGKPKRQKLITGQAMKGSAFGGLTAAAYDPDLFDEIRLMSLRPDFAGTDVIWRGYFDGQPILGQYRILQVFIERQSYELAEPQAVDFRKGTWQYGGPRGTAQVALGETVDVYLANLQMVKSRGTAEPAEEYVIDFGRPILGVITHKEGLVDTDATLGAEGVSYQAINLNLRGINADDVVSIDPNGTTLRLKMFGSRHGAHMDQVRVIVQAADHPHDP